MFAKAFFSFTVLRTRRKENIRRHGRIKKSRVSEIGAEIQPSSSSPFTTHQETRYKCFLSVQSIFSSYIYINMQLFVSGCNLQLSDLHPLKIANILSTTLTQLRRQRREDWVGISRVVEVDASTYLNITRSGSVFRRMRVQQKTLHLSPSNEEKMRFSYDAQRAMNKPNWKFPFHSTSKEFQSKHRKQFARTLFLSLLLQAGCGFGRQEEQTKNTS